MVDVMRESGSKITWRALEFISGTMAVFTKASTKTIRSMDSVFTLGLMAAVMRATGTGVSSTA